MFMARVVGTVWSTVKWDDLEGLKLLLVRPYHLDELQGGPAPSDLHDGVVVADILGAGVGEDVVVAYGHSARVAIEPHLPAGTPPTRPIDAAVVAIVDRYQVESDQRAEG
jgi:ethanolamine utilization protein EutN